MFQFAMLESEGATVRDAALQLGNLMLRTDRPDESEQLFRRVVELQELPESAIALCNLANVLLTQGRLEEAEIAFREVISSPVADLEGPGQLGLGQTLADMGRVDEANAALRRAEQVGPSQVAAFVRTLPGFRDGEGP